MREHRKSDDSKLKTKVQKIIVSYNIYYGTLDSVKS